MKCPRCQQENPSQAKFCLACATPLVLRCADCGTQLPAGAKFCFECATPVSVPGSPPRFASPEAYTPKHLAERIINSKAALEGERKQVTVLFADLKGSMELLADRDPEEARKILDPVLELMMEAVHRHEGTVNQVMGDGIMALFGAPVAHEDHAVRACYAALRMQEEVRSYAEQARRGSGVCIQIRIGLNSGEVVVRAVGSDLRMDYTAVGQTTHLAARMEQLAEPGATLLTPATLDLVEGYVTVKALGPVPIKGLPAAVEVFELTGAGAARSRLQAAAARGLTSFVGRSAELQHLTRALELAGGGHGQVVGVMGEPGVGKSRLVWEVTHSHRTQGWRTLEAGSVAHGKATAYLPVIDLLKGYCLVEAGDDARRIHEKLAGKLLALDPALLGALPALLALFGVPTGDAAWEILDAPLRRHRTIEAVCHVLLREAQVQPLLVVVEDLHWADDETQAILNALVESLPTARMLLLTNYRPEYSLAWGRKTYCSQLRLDPLSSEGAQEFLDGLLGSDPGLDGLRCLLVERTEGNPFYLEESVRTLVEGGALAGERGAYRLTRTIGSVQVPATVQSVLAARIDRLAPEHKRLLQAASVIGKDVPLALLVSLSIEPVDVVHQALAELQRAEFVYQTRLFPEAEYTFKHALTHEVAYGSMLQERRRLLHGEILAAMEQLHAGRLDDHRERLALHALRSESWEKAVAHGAEAGQRAMRRWTLGEALASFEQALTALGQLPQTRDNLRCTVELRLNLRGCLVLLGDVPPMLGHLHAAAAAAEVLEDDVLRARVTGQQAHTHFMMGQHERSLELAQRELDLARGASQPGLEAQATLLMGEARCALGEFEAAVELLKRAQLLARISAPFDYSEVPLEVVAGRWCCQALVELGRFEEAADLARTLIEIARAGDRPYTLANAISTRGFLCSRRGDFSAALPLLEEGVRFSRALGLRSFAIALGTLLAEAWAQTGRSAEAQALLEELPPVVGSVYTSGHVPRPLVLLALGRLQEARGLASAALVWYRERGERGAEAWVLWLLGEIAARQSPAEAGTAADRFRDALVRATELGMRPLVAHCHLGLGKLYRHTDKREQAREPLATATSMYRDMGMTYWLEMAEAEMAELG